MTSSRPRPLIAPNRAAGCKFATNASCHSDERPMKSQIGATGKMQAPFIPPRIRAELEKPAPFGYRHEQMKSTVLPLLAAGNSPEQVFALYRHKYESDVSDCEIWSVIAWAASKNPTPCGYLGKARQGQHARPLLPNRPSTEQAIANTEQWLNGFRIDECDLWHVSPWRPLEDWRMDAIMLLDALYNKEDFINVITDYTIDEGRLDEGQP